MTAPWSTMRTLNWNSTILSRCWGGLGTRLGYWLLNLDLPLQQCTLLVS